jgi:uncharacterized repeat protein (TIGR03943 family)
LVVAVNREAGGTTTLLVGALLLRLAITGAHRRYVRPALGPWLIAAGVVLVVLGASALVGALRRGAQDHDAHDHDAHDHGGAVERVGWVLLGPVVALLLIAPPALGSFAVDRVTRVDVASRSGTFSALPAGEATRPMSLLEFAQRAADGNGVSFNGAAVELTGFVTTADRGAGFRVARYQIACCAADAAATVVRVLGTSGSPPPRDQWVTISGTYVAGDDPDAEPQIEATSVQPIAPPEDPYE